MRRKVLLLELAAPCLPAFELDFAAFGDALDLVEDLPELPPFDLNNPF